MNQVFHHHSKVATDSPSWDLQACTRDTLWHQRYVTTSKEYLFWISISLARTGKNFMEIDHHLSELWKKEKGLFFNTVYIHVHRVPKLVAPLQIS